jgi:hypothetical protein
MDQSEERKEKILWVRMKLPQSEERKSKSYRGRTKT